jgi:hypothetical protein
MSATPVATAGTLSKALRPEERPKTQLPAIDRWPFALLHKIPITTVFIVDAMILLVGGFDLWSRGRIQGATAKGVCS